MPLGRLSQNFMMNSRLSWHQANILCGKISAADFAAYPHVLAGGTLGLGYDKQRNADIDRWSKLMRGRPEGITDLNAVRTWWANRGSKKLETERINWGTFRLEWLLANGHVDWFAEQVRQGRVLWSCGPDSNVLRSPFHRSRKHNDS